MTALITRIPTSTDDERKPAAVVGVDAQICADPLVAEYFHPGKASISGIAAGTDQPFAWRGLKTGVRMTPAEAGYQPTYVADGGSGYGALKFGSGANAGLSGGSLSDTHNGALACPLDALLFPPQDDAMGIANPYSIVVACKTPASAVGDDIYPGAIAGTMTRFPDSTSVNQNDWAGIGIGLGSISENRGFFAGRGLVGAAVSTSNDATDAWVILSGIFDLAGNQYVLRRNGVQVAVTAVTQSAPTADRAGYRQLRIGSAGDIGAAIERTYIGQIGAVAIMHAAGNAGSGLTSMQRIEARLKAMYGVA
jgi:hypothetical protein